MAKKLREQNPPGDAEISIEPEENPMEETKMEQEDKQNAFEQKEKIKEKIKKIEDNKIAAEKEKKEYEKLLAEKAEIEKSIQEIETLSVEYGKVENNLKGDRLALEEYCDEKLSQITKEIHYEKDIVAKMDKVDGKIKNIRDELKKVEGEKYKLGKIDSDEINHMKVQQSLRLEQKKFEDCKKYQKSIEGKIKELQELKKLVDSEYAKGNKKKAYFHIKDFQTKLDDQEIKNIKESDVFKEDLLNELSDMNKAKENARIAELEFNVSKEKQNTYRKQLEEAERTRTNEIYEEIAQIKSQSGG